MRPANQASTDGGDATVPGAAGTSRGAERVLRYFTVAGGRAVIVAGSTMPGEHEIAAGTREIVVEATTLPIGAGPTIRTLLIPNLPALVGVPLHVQALIEGPQGLATAGFTNVASDTIQ